MHNKWIKLYWVTRIAISLLWIVTAYVSWFAYPQAESLAWLNRVGLVAHGQRWLAAACSVDLLLGVLSIAYATRWLWQLQIALVLFYTLVIAIYLPALLIHPFGPITKNGMVLTGLVYLIMMEGERQERRNLLRTGL